MPDRLWRHVWITGASSGIGRSLAVNLAKKGVSVSISARSADKLEELSKSQANIHPLELDVTDVEATERVVAKMVKRNGPIDLAVFNAGVWQVSDAGELDLAPFSAAMDVNFMGTVTGLHAVLPSMRERQEGQIAIVASVAGYRGLPKGAYYGPSKAALINLAESLRPELKRAGIKLQIINPGFVRTPMTDVNDFPMPFLLEPDDAADRIIAGLAGNRFEIAFPWQLVAGLKIARVLPYRLFFWFIRSFVAGGKKS